MWKSFSTPVRVLEWATNVFPIDQRPSRRTLPGSDGRRLSFESLERRRLLTGDLLVRYEFTDTAQHVLDALPVGSDALLNVYVQDRRANPTGVRQAYLTVAYDTAQITIDDPIVHGPAYNLDPAGDIPNPGLIVDAGGKDSDQIAPVPPGQELLLFRVPFHVDSVGNDGTLDLLADVSQFIVRRPLFFDSVTFLELGDVEFQGSSIQIVSAGISVSPTSGLNTTEAGGTDTFNIVLTRQPTANVTIGLSSSDTSEGTVSPSSVTFTPSNWNTARTVTVTGVNDDLDDGDMGFNIVTASATSTDPNYSGLNADDVSVTNRDDDTAGIQVTPTTGLITTEAGGTATFQIVLNSQPTANVFVELTSSDTSEGTISQSSVNFTPTNWNIPRTITVNGRDDELDDGDISYSIVTAGATSSDTTYDGLNASDVSVTNLDNDTAGIQVTPTSGLETTEAGGTATFQIVLNSQPTANVIVELSSSDTSEGTISQNSVNFTPTNWDVPRTITITGRDDDLDDGDISYSIVTAAATSSDGKYQGMNASDVSVTNRDDDVAGIEIMPTSGLNTTESGGTATFDVVLNSRPTADVTIGVSSNDTGEGTVSPSSVTFTASNWNIAQRVTVTGVDDDLDDGDVAYTIVTAPATSSDPTYNGRNAPDVSVTNRDNDAAGIQVTPTSGLITTEAGGTASFQIVLGSRPTANVTIGLSSSDTSEGTVSLSSVTFTVSNWNTPRSITVTGIEDDLDDGDVAYAIVTAPATSTDPAYNGRNAADVSVTNRDNDAAGIQVTPTSGLMTTEAGGTASFQIVLGSRPTANVTIGLSSSNPDEGTVSLASVTFTVANWNNPRTITVTGVDDDIDDGDMTFTVITAPAASSDPSYNNVNPADVTVVNRNDDVAGVEVAPTSGLTTTESGTTASFNIVLTSRPTADVTVGLSSSDASEGVLSTSSVTFRPSNWNIPQSVTVTGQDDDLDDGDINYTIATSLSATGDARYSGLPVDDVMLQNLDDDTAGVEVTPTAGLITTEAGGTAFFELVLNAQPTSNVVITLSSSDTSEGTVSPPSVTFSPANWRTSQRVTVTGVDDTEQDGPVSYTINTSAVMSDDSAYRGLGVEDVSVVNMDDDTPGITVIAMPPLVTQENGTNATFSIVLNTQPTADVTIPISSSDTTEGTLSASSLVFTSSNWRTPQTVTVSGQNDDLDDGDISFDIVLAAAISTDPDYQGLDAADLSVTNLDDDTAGVQVTPTTGLTTSEAGGTATLEIVLTSEPIGDVTVNLMSTDVSEGALSAGSLTFGPADWNLPQTVVVSGVDDGVVDGDRPYNISVRVASSSDPTYDRLAVDAPLIRNLDNDSATVTLTAVSAIETEGTGSATTMFLFNVILAGDVEGGFALEYSSDDVTAVASDGDYVDNDGMLAFDGMDGESLAISIEVNQDNVVELDETFRVQLGALFNIDATAAARIAVAGSPVTAMIVDDDTTTLTVTGVSGDEGTGPDPTSFTFNVTLSNPVQGGFRVPYTTNDGTARLADGDYVDNDGQLEFLGTAGEVRTISVAVHADSIVERDESFSAALGDVTGLLSPELVDAITIISREASGNIRNDDTARISFAAPASDVLELTGRHVVDVVLNVSNGGVLSEDVAVMINDLRSGTATSPGDYTLDTTMVTFPAGSSDGDTRSVLLTLVRDDVMEVDETVQLMLSVVGDGIGGNVTDNVGAAHLMTVTDDPMTASLSGLVWWDANNDGRLNANEVGVPGVTVTLTGVDRRGQAIESVSVTAADGSYRFDNLFAGTYSIVERQPDTYRDGRESLGTVAGVANGTAGEDQFFQIVIGPAETGRDYNFGERRVTMVSKRAFLASSLRSRLAGSAAIGEAANVSTPSGGRFLSSTLGGDSNPIEPRPQPPAAAGSSSGPAHAPLSVRGSEPPPTAAPASLPRVSTPPAPVVASLPPQAALVVDAPPPVERPSLIPSIASRSVDTVITEVASDSLPPTGAGKSATPPPTTEGHDAAPSAHVEPVLHRRPGRGNIVSLRPATDAATNASRMPRRDSTHEASHVAPGTADIHGQGVAYSTWGLRSALASRAESDDWPAKRSAVNIFADAVDRVFANGE